MNLIEKLGFEKSENGLPELVWPVGDGFMHLEIMKTDTGWWAIISKRSSGVESGRVNIGHYTTDCQIDDLIYALTKAT